VTDDLVAFLKARLDEDEQAARDAHYEGQRWLSEEEDVCRWPDDELVHIADRKRDARHIARWDPARVLAEVQAKRRLLTQFELRGNSVRATVHPSTGGVWDDLLRLLALPYASHPDYRSEWASDTEVTS
jgi:uncharacterized protein DUF6221